MAGQPKQRSSSATVANSYGDASDMLAEALKQMDGLLADTTKPPCRSVSNGHYDNYDGVTAHFRQVANGGTTLFNSASLPKMSRKLQTTRAVWLFNDLYTSLKALENPSAVFQLLPVETQEYFVGWLSDPAQLKDQQVPVGRPNLDPHKLDLMAENSSLKVRLAKLEKHLQDSDEKFSTAQLKIDELQSRLNDRTIEVTELRTRLARSAPSSPNHSHYEVEKLKQAVETLMATNEEKNMRIEELRSAVKHYKRMEEMLVKMQGAKVLEQLGVDGDNVSDGSSAHNSNGSSSDNAHVVDARTIMDGTDALDHREFLVSGILNPPVTSTPVNNHSVGDSPFISSSLKRNPHLMEGASSALNPPASVNSTQTDARSSSYDDIISSPSSKTPPTTIRKQADTYVKADAEEETLKDEMAQQYKALQSQVHTEPLKKKNSSKGLKKFFVKIKRSNSQSMDDKPEDFKRSGLRSTAGPRLGWSKELNDLGQPFGRWDKDRVALWLHVLGLSMYVGECKRWVKNGDHLLQATSHDLEKELGIRNHFHRKKLQLALQAINAETRSPVAELDHTWVTRWLDDIGLPQYKDQFSDARIDGRMLHCLTVDDLIGLKVTNQLHHLSLQRGIQVLRMNNFSPSCLKRRPAPDEEVLQNCPDRVVLWTNHRVMEWLRNIDLSEYAPNLRGSGVHGALMVLEPRFGAEIFATILSIPSNKTLLRRHLSTHFVTLIGSAVQQQKREVEAQPGYTPLTPSLRVKVKKGIFRNLKGSDDRDDFVCPIDPHSDRGLCLNGGGSLPRKDTVDAPREEDEHLLARDHRYLDNVPTSDV